MRCPRSTALVVAVAAVSMLFGSCFSGDSAPTDSGIVGLVTIGPTSPVQREGDPGEAPYSAILVIRDSAGGRVAEVASGDDGRFTVNLEPGTYVLDPQNPGIFPFAQPQEVTVEAHSYTEVTVPYDSGIR